MRLALATNILIGETLANPIYTEYGMMFINKGNKINETILSRLKKMGITTIYIEDGNDDITLQEVLPTPSKLKLIISLKELFEEVKKKDYIDERKTYEILHGIMENLNLSENAALINNLVPNDDLSKLAMHSLNVTILTLMVCIHKKYDDMKLLKIGEAALLHDIGKLYINDKAHVVKARDLIKRNPSFMSTTYMAIYNLYERVDGAGQFKVPADKIHEFSKILSICNEYINYIDSDDPLLPHIAIEKIMADVGTKFDQAIYSDFTQSLYCYPNGLQIKLNNGQKGIVVMQNSGFTLRPILGLYSDDGLKFCNLVENQNLTLFIDEVII
jgi:HD-GYP domain-containing protein (c-di-GMP phosphodiesterase class II)